MPISLGLLIVGYPSRPLPFTSRDRWVPSLTRNRTQVMSSVSPRKVFSSFPVFFLLVRPLRLPADDGWLLAPIKRHLQSYCHGHLRDGCFFTRAVDPTTVPSDVAWSLGSLTMGCLQPTTVLSTGIADPPPLIPAGPTTKLQLRPLIRVLENSISLPGPLLR
jgi:hypothetical protein